MNKMVESLYLFVLSCVYLTVESQTGQILPPQNLSVLWIGDFEPKVTWDPPPQYSESDCQYTVATQTSEEDSLAERTQNLSVWQKFTVMHGGLLDVSVTADCNGTKSDPAVVHFNYTVMVKNLQCYIISSKQANCSWDSLNFNTVHHFFYRLVIDNPDESSTLPSPLPPLQECPSYRYTEGIRTGCNLEANFTHRIHILFNGTVNNKFFRNTFWKLLRNDVRPLPPEWTVHKKQDKFIIKWSPLDIGTLTWNIVIKYTECNKERYTTVGEGTSAELDRAPYCQYRIAIQAEDTHNGFNTSWSDEKRFDADTGANVLPLAAIIIPLLFAILAVLTLVWCRKNREHLFPKIPEPRDLISDISDNNNKGPGYNLYVPAQEEENCKIILVTNPQPSKPAC